MHSIRLVLVFFTLIVSSSAHPSLLEKRPGVVVCSVAGKSQRNVWSQIVFYMSGTQKGGVTLYKSLTSNPVLVKIDDSGIVSAPNLSDCDGKHVDDLVKNNQAAMWH